MTIRYLFRRQLFIKCHLVQKRQYMTHMRGDVSLSKKYVYLYNVLDISPNVTYEQFMYEMENKTHENFYSTLCKIKNTNIYNQSQTKRLVLSYIIEYEEIEQIINYNYATNLNYEKGIMMPDLDEDMKTRLDNLDALKKHIINEVSHIMLK